MFINEACSIKIKFLSLQFFYNWLVLIYYYFFFTYLEIKTKPYKIFEV